MSLSEEEKKDFLDAIDKNYDAWRRGTKPLKDPLEFVVKDSGERITFGGGMLRDAAAGKVDYTLAFDGPMFYRYAQHLHKGAQKYSPRNWMKAEGESEMERFRQSATRHFLQWLSGEQDEDHAAAVMFNLNGYEYVREKMRERPLP